MFKTQSELPTEARREMPGLGPVFCHDEDEIMNVAALLTYLQKLQRVGKTIDLVEFALAEAVVLHESGNETIDLNNFAHQVGLRVLSVLE